MTFQYSTASLGDDIELSKPVAGEPLMIGTGFEAHSFKHGQFDGLMDPVVMVDHFVMTAATFGAHPHAGMSAVSVLFEDSVGLFHNRDSLGNDFNISPGDLYWLKAGSGAVHDEAPRPGARVHALQIFVNLPAVQKADAPESLHVPARTMPVIEGDKHRVRVVLGESNGLSGAKSPAMPMTILDISLASGGSYAHPSSPSQTTWILAVRGDANILIGDRRAVIRQGTAIAVLTEADPALIDMHSDDGAHLALLQGTPVRESFVQQGPFVMNTMEEIEFVNAAYASGRLGSLD